MTAVVATTKKTNDTTDGKKAANPDDNKAAGKAAVAATVDVVPVPAKELEKLKAKAARFEEVEDLEGEVEDKRGVYLDLKDRAGRAKKELDASIDRLQKRIRDPQNLLYPPTDKPAAGNQKQGDTNKSGQNGNQNPPTGNQTAPNGNKPTPADDDAWKRVTLEELGIDKPNVLARLFDEGIKNFGQLEEWRASGKKIAGLGDAARQLIEDAVVAYWAKNPRQEKPKDVPPAKGEPTASAASSSPAGDDLSPQIIEIKPKGDLDSGKVFDVLDLGLSEGIVAKAAHPDLADAIKRGTPDVTTLFRDPKGHRFAAAFNPTAPANAGLFLLFRVFDKSTGKPTAKDPYYGAAFTFGDLTLFFGPLLDAVSVKDVLRKTGTSLVAEERRRQVEAEGYSTEHDDMHSDGALSAAAACYREAEGPKDGMSSAWPWSTKAWKPKDRLHNLVRAGALFLAEKERLIRAGSKASYIKEVEGFISEVATKIDTLLGVSAEAKS